MCAKKSKTREARDAGNKDDDQSAKHRRALLAIFLLTKLHLRVAQAVRALGQKGVEKF